MPCVTHAPLVAYQHNSTYYVAWGTRYDTACGYHICNELDEHQYTCKPEKQSRELDLPVAHFSRPGTVYTL